MGSKIVLELKHGRDNPRNSEGAFITLSGGRVLYAYTRYYGRSWHDEATAVIAGRYSADGGRTWAARDSVLVEDEGGCNVMSVSLLRLQDGRIALFYLRKNSGNDCRAYMRISDDEAETWSRPVLTIPAPGYFVTNNDRVIQLRSGRLVVPATFHRSRLAVRRGVGHGADSRGIFMMFLSDDGGKTWRESADWWALPVKSDSGLQEAGAVELRNGDVYGWSRTTTGRQWELRSKDGADTWTPPEPSRFQAPCSPLSIKRIPATGDLLAVWNDHHTRWRHLPGVRGARYAESNWGRTPLTTAISGDDGRTWRRHKAIETDPRRGFCYTAMHFTDDAVLLAYCCGGRHGAVLQDACIRRITLDWLLKT